MSAVQRLSKFIVLPIYSKWLDVTEFCLVDSALCNITERKHFSNLIRLENVQFIGITHSSALNSFVKWVVIRQLALSEINLRDKQLELISSEVLLLLGKLRVLSRIC